MSCFFLDSYILINRQIYLPISFGEAGTNSLVMHSYGPPHMAEQKQDDQHEHIFSNCVRIRDVVRKTYQRRWTIGKSGERGSGISVLPARHDDDDDIYIYILGIRWYIYIYIYIYIYHRMPSSRWWERFYFRIFFLQYARNSKSNWGLNVKL